MTIPAYQRQEEPIYINYQTIDEFVKNEPSTELNSEDSDHELLDENTASARLSAAPLVDNLAARTLSTNADMVDHMTVRNLEEANKFAQRKVIIERFYESEMKYLKYLNTLSKLMEGFEKLKPKEKGFNQPPFSPSEIKIIFFKITDLIIYQKQLVEFIEKRLQDWRPGTVQV